MTLGSALPWRACSPLGRITIQSPRRQGLPLSSVLKDSRAVRSPAVVRFQSTERAQSADAGSLASYKRPRTHDAAVADARLSLLDRLDRTPLWLHGDEEPVVVRPAVAYPNKRETREALQKKHRALTQQARVERRRKQPRAGDWRAILHHLIRWTPTSAPVQDGIKVIIPEHSAKLLWSDYENNVWNIKSRTGCDMTLWRPLDGEDAEKEGEDEAEGSGERQSAGTSKDPYIVLVGQPTAVSAAVYDILKVTKGVTIIGLKGGTPTVLHEGRSPQPPPTHSAAPMIAPTRIPHYPMSAPCRPYMLSMRADQIPRPSEWTIESFQHYVAALTMGRVPQSLAAKLYLGADTHQGTVVRRLHDLFNDPAASAAVSSPAFKLALQYLVRAGETFVKDARSLFGSVGALGLRLDTDVYNLLAETSVKSKNLLAFEGTIRRMTACGHAPNLRTWLLFLRLVEAEDVRRYILHAMHTKNFFADARTVASVSVEMADHDVHRAIQLGQDFDAFIAGLRALYGPEWQLQRRAANRYLDVFGRYSKFEESRKLLEYMFASEYSMPDVISLNTVLTHCKLQNKVDLAVCFVRMFDQRRCRVADDITFHLLFEVARKTRKMYLQSAVWRYAHVLGLTKHRMRDRAIKLLAEGGREAEYMTYWIRPLWEGPDGCKISKKDVFETLLLCDARRFNVARQLQAGQQGSRSESSPSENKISRDNPSAQDSLTESLPERSPEHSPEHNYYLYANSMSRLAQQYMPAVPLGDFLQAALDHDRKLRKMVLNGEKVADEMLLHTAQLPLVRQRTAGGYHVNPVLDWLAQRTGKKTEEDGIVQKKMGQKEEAAAETGLIFEGKGMEIVDAVTNIERVSRTVQAEGEMGLMAEMMSLEAAQLKRQREGSKKFGVDGEPEETPHETYSERKDAALEEGSSQEVAEPLQQEEPIDNLGVGGEVERLPREIQPEPVTTEKANDVMDNLGSGTETVDDPHAVDTHASTSSSSNHFYHTWPTRWHPASEPANISKLKDRVEGSHQTDMPVEPQSKAGPSPQRRRWRLGASARRTPARTRTRPQDSEEHNMQPSDGISRKDKLPPLESLEDREARERAHMVLHYLLSAAEKFGDTKPLAQASILGTLRAGAGMGVQHPALSAGPLGPDGWYAAGGGGDGREEMPSGYLLGPNRDFEGSRMQYLTGHEGR